MGSLWRDSVHGLLHPSSPDDAEPEGSRAIALLAGIDPVRAIALVRTLAPMARARVASDLDSTLSIARVLLPDFVLLGCGLEGTDIATVLDAFAADPLLDSIPVIVLATHDDDASELQALRGGALAWLPTTFLTEALLARVRLAVRMRWNSGTPSDRGASA